jgi:hypothetical protein
MVSPDLERAAMAVYKVQVQPLSGEVRAIVILAW